MPIKKVTTLISRSFPQPDGFVSHLSLYYEDSLVYYIGTGIRRNFKLFNAYALLQGEAEAYPPKEGRTWLQVMLNTDEGEAITCHTGIPVAISIKEGGKEIKKHFLLLEASIPVAEESKDTNSKDTNSMAAITEMAKEEPAFSADFIVY